MKNKKKRRNSSKNVIARNPEKEKTFSLRHSAVLNYSVLTLFGITTGLLSLLLGAAYYGMPLFWAYFSHPLIILLNLLPPVLLVLLMYFITGRAWIGFTIPSLLMLVLAAIGFFKLQIRGDPFLAADMSLISETGNIITSYRLTLNWKIFFAAAVFLCCVWFSVFALKRVEKKPAVRIAGTAAAIICCALSYKLVYTNTEIYDNLQGGFEAKQWSFTENYIAKGFVYPFIHSTLYAFPEIPDGYSKNEARELLADYTDEDIPESGKVNIISIMLEAYADLSQFDVLDFEIDVYGPLHRLQEQSVSGNLITNVFGGGTIDTERLFLTGYTRLTNYSSATNSYIRYLNRQGYHTEGLHAGDGWFYDRVSVNIHLGFKNYYYLDDFENGSREDSFFFPAVKELYDARDKDTPYFSYSLSYQNHGAYDDSQTVPPYYIAQGELSGESFCILNNYLAGIYDTTLRMEAFIRSLADDPEPVIVIMFGDHMPWLGNYESVYSELGITTNVGTQEGFYNLYSTPYIIWANASAKETLGNDFTEPGSDFSPCFLLGEVFRLCSWDGEGYMQALRNIKNEVDIINTPTGLFRIDGELTLDLPPDTLEAWRDFRKLEYYRLHNFFQ